MSAGEIVKADDFVECFIFPFNDESLTIESFDALYEDIQLYIQELSKGYIWHKDALTLHKRFYNNGVSLNEEDKDFRSHIHGICHYGDDIEDEWFIVYLMKEVTAKYHSVTAKVADIDCEFLLIEAALSLPSWADPHNSTNRVFFYKGSLLLIPPEDNEDTGMTIPEAMKCIKSNSQQYIASEKIVQDINLRIMNYPNGIKDLLHRTRVYTPVGVAALLKEDPTYISAAVHAFCNRDPIDMKVCRAMKYFPPENRVSTSVTLTKNLYAMLLHNNYDPDRRTGWKIPLQNSPQYKAHSLGVKLACGFEILVSQAKPDNPLESNKAWLLYLENLKNRNYFQGLLEGSAQYNTLLDNAKDYFLNNLESVKIAPILGMKILNMLNNLTIDEHVFKKMEPFLPNDDDDSWLSVNRNELEEMLQKRYGKKNFFNLNGEVGASKVSGKISEFLEHVSGLEGVEFPENSKSEEMETGDVPVRPRRGVKKNKRIESLASDDSRSPSLTRKYNIDFDPDQFSGALQNILDFVIPEDKFHSESDLSDYGSDGDIESDIFDVKCRIKDKPKDTIMEEYMKEMDAQLSSTSIGKSFEIKIDKGDTSVDLEKNMLVNMTKSYKEEAGGTGPAGNILGPLGFAKYDHFDSIDEEVD